MIIEDDPFQCKLLAHQLENLGTPEVDICANGTEPLAKIDAGRVPDLLLLDLNLPDMDGIEVLRHLAERNYSGEVILLSGEDEIILDSAERLARLHQLRILGKVTKPVTQKTLASLLISRSPSSPARPQREGKLYTPEEVARAIAHGELTGFYQPKVQVPDRRVIGAEYLVRWHHPEDGLVFPDQFVPIAEAHGLIGDLTLAVFADALAQLREWQKQGLKVKIAINVSMEDLCNPTFAEQVIELCEQTGVSPESLALEVTESRLESNLSCALEVLTRLHLRHFQLSIDDFGTGHSSLARLIDLPFNQLKIDRRFTHRAWEDPRRLAVFQASLDIGRRLVMEVVAEGVEDEEDWRFLEKNGCPIAQGYHIARPLPARDFASWLQQHRTRKIRNFDDALLGMK